VFIRFTSYNSGQNVLKSDKMSLFNSFFGNSGNGDNSQTNINWIDLTKLSQLDEIEQKSSQDPILIFKHSTRCSISRMALKNFEREFDLQNDIAPYFLDLLEHRDISNEIANRFQVQHQSPQLLLIQNGNAVYNASHSDIDAEKLKKFV